jgi:two-component system, OmpR family, sensor histidine kinase MprB
MSTLSDLAGRLPRRAALAIRTTNITRAISNLLDNAVKWSSPDDPIEVTVAAGVCSVRDYGVGIAAEDLPHVFDRFYRAANARTLPGSGLGLAIVRQVAEAHHGNATAGAAPGGGTIISIRLPAGPLAPGAT